MDEEFLQQFSNGLTITAGTSGQPNGGTVNPNNQTTEEGPSKHINYGNGILIFNMLANYTTTDDINNLCKDFGHVVFCSVGDISTPNGIIRMGVALFKNSADAAKAVEILSSVLVRGVRLYISLVNGSSPELAQEQALMLTSLYFLFHTYDLIEPERIEKERQWKILRYFEEFLYIYAT